MCAATAAKIDDAGGVINISYEGPDYDEAKAFDHVARIHDTLLEIFKRAEAQGVPTSEAADRIAEERFQGPDSGGHARSCAA